MRFNRFILLFLLFSLIPTCSVSAASKVIAEEKTWGYEYKLIKTQDSFTWKIRQHHITSTISENKDNREDLDRFKSAVDNIHRYYIDILISVVYLIIAVPLVKIFLKKKKVSPRDAKLILFAVVMIVYFYSVSPVVELFSAYEDADYYFFILSR
ncbi:geobacillin-26 family protein [Bacillus sp. NEB1478]|uniref:geobacillin-26 family protein n=1 Tax=Bacillus sp. NEB1478 TaxID=3073816 RepID=UPI002872D4AA|nr:geobacillin-26 family protein [Bacillus sp. NEB1478]WNB91153.1 geobacillin-26 family protein [Bacillus sp. NEB1478]